MKTKYFVLMHFFWPCIATALKFPHPLQSALSKRNSRLLPPNCLVLLFKMPKYVWLSWNESLFPPFSEYICKLHGFELSSKTHRHTFKQKIIDLKNYFGRMLNAMSKNTPPSTCIISLLGFIGVGIFCLSKYHISFLNPTGAKCHCSSHLWPYLRAALEALFCMLIAELSVNAFS